MMILLHENATTTPGIRQRLLGRDEPAAVPARRDWVGEETTHE